MVSVRFFKTIEDSNYLDEIKYSKKKISFAYKKGSDYKDLEYSETDSILEVKDSKHEWDITEMGLRIKLSFSISNCCPLFGPDGITTEDSELGVAAICTSTVSDRLEAFKIASITKKDNQLSIDTSFELEKGKYRGNIVIKLALYLLKPGKRESGFPHKTGTLLGAIDEFAIRVSDNGNLFPIYEGDYPGMPLWWVNCQWTDIELDPFDKENVCVVINRSSKGYVKIQRDNNNPDYCPGYLAEVMASAIQVIIEKIRSNSDDWSKIMSDRDYTRGSIADTIQYMRKTFEWDFNTPESLAKDIRAYISELLGC